MRGETITCLGTSHLLGWRGLVMCSCYVGPFLTNPGMEVLRFLGCFMAKVVELLWDNVMVW